MKGGCDGAIETCVSGQFNTIVIGDLRVELRTSVASLRILRE
jgi:hypothetical protein